MQKVSLAFPLHCWRIAAKPDTQTKNFREGTMERRDVLRLTAGGLVGLAATEGMSPAIAAGDERPDLSLMMFPGNYTWSAATRMVVASEMWGGADMGEHYRAVASLKPDAG